MVAQRAHLRGQVVVIGGDRAAFAPRTEVLAGIKAEASRRSDRAGVKRLPLVIEPGAMRLARILDYLQVARLSEVAQFDHRSRQSVEMHRQYRARSIGRREARALQVARDFRNAQIAGIRIDIHECRPRAGLHDRLGGRDKRHRRSDNFVARTDSDRKQRKPERVGPARHADYVTRAEECGEFTFKCGHLRAAHV